VNDFLDFARPVKLNRSRVNLQELCDRAATIALGDAVGLDVEVALPDSRVEAEIDPDRMHQVLLNLLANAGDAAAQGVHGRVTLKLYREPRQAVIEVHDDGPGIPPDAPIFDAFFSTKSTGTGLGLAITHRIVDDHGGRVEVESKPGHTMFRVCLPLSDPERPPSSRAPTLE
jgi:signal transduction histidine kinase